MAEPHVIELIVIAIFLIPSVGCALVMVAGVGVYLRDKAESFTKARIHRAREFH